MPGTRRTPRRATTSRVRLVPEDWPQALSQMREVVKILPGRALYRENLATFLSYSSDFQAGEQEARAIQDPSMFGLLALAFAQVGQGQLAQAEDTYNAAGPSMPRARLHGVGPWRPRTFEGRFSDAERLLAGGAEDDLKSQDSERAAAKYAALGYARLQQRKMGPAIAAAEEALKASQDVKYQFLAARIFVEAGEFARAAQLAAGLGKHILAEPRAYGKIVEAGLARRATDLNKAMTLLMEANTLFDTWIGHFDLGRTYLDVAIAAKISGCSRRRIPSSISASTVAANPCPSSWMRNRRPATSHRCCTTGRAPARASARMASQRRTLTTSRSAAIPKRIRSRRKPESM